MLESIQIHNIEGKLSDWLVSCAEKAAKDLPPGSGVHAHFSRTKGIYTGSLQVLSKWGEAYTLVEDQNVFSMGHKLKTKMKSQIRRKRDRFYSHQVSRKSKRELQRKQFTDDFYIEPLQIECVPKKTTKILIVDDDVDSMVLIDEIFRKFGCETEFAIEAKDASRKITAGKADIIILDWMLNEATAKEVMQKTIHNIQKFADLEEKFTLSRPKIITYSGLGRQRIELPENTYFEHIDHWEKPIGSKALTQKTSKLLYNMGA